ncbi:Phenylacetic acid degradation protein paaI [Paramagnetospirillum magnetotacticum MS-1]|uniref:Phenylacetic acid degradation protein paaI n=1 Tax=Paramagnetospirillum magnetotacticum MS-1 TaxID=272627 RepID=A0A0C2UZT9_PARME|nr:hydroxyphenylacetyl-CoA thioesterase PaaI [Paramagnetospirillum magnetotacticum]KIL98346.1 Phenylacetic acid degradation protein paaI [Paramagnetospirillum magnetotacticum MS-1]
MPHRATEETERKVLAERVGAFITERDTAARSLGIALDEIRPGYARMSMTVTADMLNGAGIGHGGVTYTLADTAFACACNAYNRVAVALSCSITYPAAARLGDRLTAQCHEVHRKGRNGTYDCTVTNQSGELIALFRGQCRVLEGHLVEGNP